MNKQAVQPPEIMESVYGPRPKERAVRLPDLVSLGVRELFPDIEEGIYSLGGDISAVGKATQAALSAVDMDMIKPGDTVNLLSSEHGYSILGGEPYVEMLSAIKAAVREKTGCKNIRLVVGAYRGFRESDELIEHFDLKRRFDGKVIKSGPYDKGVPIETEIGKLYGIKKIYDSDWFIHSYYDDPREMYFSRLIERAFKAFAMSYARFETRSVFHMSFGNRSANFLSRAIFNAPYVQKRYAFSCFLRTSPTGILTVDADNDLVALNKRITVSHLKTYGKMMRLFKEIDECIAVLDGGRWAYYLHAGGVIFGVLMFVERDPLDLSVPYAMDLFEKAPGARGELQLKSANPAIKAVVINQAWPGISMLNLSVAAPIIMVGEEQAQLWRADHSNPALAGAAQTVDSLEEAMDKAREQAKTDKVIIFDGNFGSINLSPCLAEFLLKKAPEVSEKVDRELLPMWLRQRGIDPEGV